MEITADILKLVLYGRYKRSLNLALGNTKGSEVVTSPRQVCVMASSIPGLDLGVFCCSRIKQGAEMGPFVGNVITLKEIDCTRLNPAMWELFDDDGQVVGFVDGNRRAPANWLSYIQCARSEREQNLEVIQVGGNIFYKATKDIEQGDELLVWYGSSHLLYMGLPSTRAHQSEDRAENRTPTMESCFEGQPPRADFTGSKMRCVICRRGFNSRSNLRSHMRIHTLEKPFSCKFCGRHFSQSSTLRNHVRLHTGEKPYKCVVCRSSYSQLAGLRAHQRSATHRPQTHVHD